MSTGWSTENQQLYPKWICGLQLTMISDPCQAGERRFLRWTHSNQTGSALLLCSEWEVFCALTDFQDTKMIPSDLKCRWGFHRDLQWSDSSYCCFPLRSEHCPDCYKELFHNLAWHKKQKQKLLEFFPFLQYSVMALKFLGRINWRNYWILTHSAHRRAFTKHHYLTRIFMVNKCNLYSIFNIGICWSIESRDPCNGLE